MSATGTATLSFGAAPGNTEASVAVTGQGAITTSSNVEAFLQGETTTDHSEDEHLMASAMIDLVCSKPVNATGFTIYGFSREKAGLVGDFTVHWVWV